MDCSAYRFPPKYVNICSSPTVQGKDILFWLVNLGLVPFTASLVWSYQSQIKQFMTSYMLYQLLYVQKAVIRFLHTYILYCVFIIYILIFQTARIIVLCFNYQVRNLSPVSGSITISSIPNNIVHEHSECFFFFPNLVLKPMKDKLKPTNNIIHEHCVFFESCFETNEG
jgi:hypothetical protein